jgi:DNA-binding NarL/FixJ family response regulator
MSPSWYRSVLYEYAHRKGGVNESLICLRPVPGATDEFDGVVLLRATVERDFSGRHRLLVREAYTVIAPLIGGALAHFAEPSPGELPPRVRDVLRCLLEGDSDKQAAVRLGISKYTVNQHAKAIFRHFRVTTRSELLARWVRSRWSNGFAW